MGREKGSAHMDLPLVGSCEVQCTQRVPGSKPCPCLLHPSSQDHLSCPQAYDVPSGCQGACMLRLMYRTRPDVTRGQALFLVFVFFLRPASCWRCPWSPCGLGPDAPIVVAS